MESSSRSPRAVRVTLALAWAVAATFLVASPVSATVLQEADCEARLAAAPGDPIGTGTCPGVRPGAYVDAPQGGCTLGFLFAAAEHTAQGPRTARYIATAGHCVIGDTGEKSWGYNHGPKAFDAAGDKIGEFIYGVVDYGGSIVGPYRDFGLIRLDGDAESRAAVCHFGGPTAVNNDLVEDPQPIHHYGQGLGIGETVPARTSLARLNDPDVAGGTGVINYGDSGSPAITDDGRAVGLIVQFIEETGPGTFGVTRLRPQVLRAEKVLDVNLTLLTAALR